MFRGLSLGLIALMIVSNSGCSQSASDAPKLAPISGVVKVDGQPLENPIVTFYPEKGPSGIGLGNERGEFTVKTNGANGAPIGKCKVTVTNKSGTAEVPPADGNEMELLKKATLNRKYASQDTTDLIVDVTAEGNKNLQLDLDK